MSIDALKIQIKWVNKEIVSLRDAIKEEKEYDELYSVLQDLENEVRSMIDEAEDIIEALESIY